MDPLLDGLLSLYMQNRLKGRCPNPGSDLSEITIRGLLTPALSLPFIYNIRPKRDITQGLEEKCFTVLSITYDVVESPASRPRHVFCLLPVPLWERISVWLKMGYRSASRARYV